MWIVHSRSRGEWVCSLCLLDDALASAARAFGEAEECSYCGQAPAAPEGVLLVDDLVQLVADGLGYEYEPPEEQVSWDSREGGWLLPVTDTYDVLTNEEITEDPDLLDDLVAGLGQWQLVERDPYSLSPAEALISGWHEFRNFVINQRRYTFLNHRGSDDGLERDPDAIPLTTMLQLISEAVSAGEFLVTLPAGTTWWRGRPHPEHQFYSSAKDLGSPPKHFARDNRMSPKGIGAFYGADSPQCARAEVAAYAKDAGVITMAEFRLCRPAKMLDLRRPPSLPSLFDPDKRDRRPFIRFLRDFVRDVVKTAEPSDIQNLDYIPTQIVAEHLRFDLVATADELDGIMWRSSQYPSGIACVIFAGNAQMGEPSNVGKDTILAISPETVVRVSAHDAPEPEDEIS